MTQTLESPAAQNGNRGQNLPAISAPRLPYHPAIEDRYGVDKSSWKALVEAIFPNASTTESVILALSYCRARKLDPFKRNVHIVPIWNRDLRKMVDTIWPGIGELRTTAFRTGEYAGRDAATFGPIITGAVGKVEMAYPEWCQVTVYRLVRGQRVAFSGPQVYWIETYATASRENDSPNEMWATRTRGQIEKCAEAAALRAAFPEEIGSDYIAEEVQHQPRSVDAKAVPTKADALADKVAAQKRIPSEGQRIEMETGEVIEGEVAEEAAAYESGVIEPSVGHETPGPTESDVAGADDQPPADALESLDGMDADEFKCACRDARDRSIDRPTFEAIFDTHLKLVIGKVGKPLTGKEKRALFTAFKENRIDGMGVIAK